MLAPNSPLRAQVTALAREASSAAAQSDPCTNAPSDDEDRASRSAARYLCAMLIARLFEVVPLTCPHCGAEMQIIAFVTETPSVPAILVSLGEPACPPPVSPARGPPAWEDDPVAAIPDSDPLAQPEYEFDQRVQWSLAFTSPDRAGDGERLGAPPVAKRKPTRQEPTLLATAALFAPSSLFAPSPKHLLANPSDATDMAILAVMRLNFLFL